jgi:hypothetical protein
VDQLPEADVVFIDTSHDYRQTLAELRTYRWLCRSVMVCHDTELAHPAGVVGPPYPVRRAVAEFCAAEGLSVTWRRNCWGLAIIEMG